MLRNIAVIVSALIFSSCSNKSQSDLAVFKATEEGFLYSNAAISNSTDVIYRALHEKLLQPETAMQASKWQPRAMLIKEKSAETFKYLDSLITELKKEADLRLIMESMKEVYNEDDLDAVNRLFVKKNAGDKLFEKLQKYKNDILAVDPELNKEFGDNSILITREFEQSKVNGKDFTKTFFDNVPAIAAVAMLRRLENNVSVLENKFVTYFFNKIGSTGGWGQYTRIEPILALSSSYVKAGDKIEMHAGIGSFSLAAKPVVYIGGKIIEPNENGIVVYKFRAPGKVGKNNLPLKIEFTLPNGKREFLNMKAEYTVAE